MEQIIEKKDYFVVGDVHGKYAMLVDLLTKWDRECQQLIFLGDLIDRGEDSKSCLELVCQLVTEEGAICLTGNHERMFLAWLDDPAERYDHYRRNGGDTTINSLLGRPLDASVDALADAQEVRNRYSDLIQFLKACPYHLETDAYIFVHAGVDLEREDWQNTSNHDKVWLRDLFYEVKNRTEKTIVFGHTPVHKLFNSPVKTNQIWRSSDQKIGIDGGAVYGGVLHGIVLGPSGLTADYAISTILYK